MLGRARRGGHLVVLVAAVVAAWGCAPTRESVHHPQDLHMTVEDQQRIAATARLASSLQEEVQGLREELARMNERLGFTEQRTGLKPLKSKALENGRPGEAIRYVDLTRLEAGSKRGTRVNLPHFMKSYDGMVVSFWATWCVPCISREELRHVRELRRQLRRHNVALLSVAVDDLGDVLGHKRVGEWIYPLWHGRGAHLEMLPRSLVERSGVGLPLFLLVGRDGRILHYVNHQLDKATVRDMVTAMAGAR